MLIDLHDRDVIAKAESALVIETQPPLISRLPGATRFWVLDKLDPPQSCAECRSAVAHRRGLAADIIEKVFGRIVERHETLRTWFTEIDGEPF